MIPPAAPRPGKTLCDGDGTYLTKAEAQKLLRAGANLGLISQNCLSIWPENVWMVYNDIVYEARLQNSVAGEYHGYPLMADDPFREVVLKVWHERQRT